MLKAIFHYHYKMQIPFKIFLINYNHIDLIKYISKINYKKNISVTERN